ncbi:cytochrome o ubiquinol oxidase, subunit II [Candidatus Protochlamydia naegleriophila]|uniref:Ubiquinol oxidase polypeptide II n=1 Tax=Candidatus Protochlamydia naegleriophila TaxID=389348 RepID=A0A0U5K2G8_9BACT|nr:ubiquinol oxidase subunit II [Candidatus Protochlamydia naegleriophila]CUI16299.1 cytochrome o ubiquinol oxidase, subunit II [Candidatus Protochlamydia naegleriophila]
MKMARKQVFSMLFFTGLLLLTVLIMQPLEILHFREYIAVLFPKGIIAVEQRNLLLVIQALMLLIIIPVYILTFIFSWKYSAHNPKGEYDPDLVDNTVAEYIWWGVPLVMTLIVSVLTWIKTEQLDPYKPIASENKPLTIQVVALQWKWLFIYPEEGIATVNFIQIPKDTPIHFKITADAPMNSFWIPELGGQIYAMPKMQTELFLMAEETGDFRGSSANLSGEGFAGMSFVTRASTEEEYQKWVEQAKQSSKNLDFGSYGQLSAPSKNNPVEIFRLKDESLFHQVIAKYMHP